MDEGRYVRQAPRGVGTGAGKQEKPALTGITGIDAVYRDLLEARKACGIEGAIPSRQQIGAFLERQESTLREKFGDREVEFRVVTEGGKPKIRARARK
jgi:hypothetical protein